MLSSKTAAFICFLFAALHALSQTAAPNSSATVHVLLTNGAQKPLESEVVLFIGPAKTISGRTDAAGKCTVLLPAGAVYAIRLKTMVDTADHSSIEIPALQPGQSFTQPYTVTIEYDPPRVFTLDHVYFDTGKPTLRPESFAELNEIADYMKMKPGEHYEIGGHTDNIGKEADNLRLSQQRADAVRAYLIKKGIAAPRLRATGYGASRPVEDNSTAEGRQHNRRTEVMVEEGSK